MFRERDSDESVTPVTFLHTFTKQVALLPPSALRTVTAALPEATAVTRPLLSTVATVSLLLLQVTAVLSGGTFSTAEVRVAVRAAVPPGSSSSVAALRLTASTEVGRTVTGQLA